MAYKHDSAAVCQTWEQYWACFELIQHQGSLIERLTITHVALGQVMLDLNRVIRPDGRYVLDFWTQNKHYKCGFVDNNSNLQNMLEQEGWISRSSTGSELNSD